MQIRSERCNISWGVQPAWPQLLLTIPDTRFRAALQWYFGWIVEFDDGTAACACSNCGYAGTYSEDFQMMCTKDERTKSGGPKPGRKGGKSGNAKPGGNARRSEDEDGSQTPQ